MTAALMAAVVVAAHVIGGNAAPNVLRGVNIEDAAFLEGDWRASQDDGELTQEVWSQPAGNNMMGMFRWLGGEGTARVFEILTITEEDQTLVLRLRQRAPDGAAYEYHRG